MRIKARMNSEDKGLNESHIEESEDDEDDDSTSRSSSPDHVSYRTRPEWSDIEPISIRTQTSIMDIKYTAKYEEAFSYLRAMLVRDELSERSLALTADCIELQRSNFTVWYFRRRILRKLAHYLPEEFAFTERVIEDEPKNYQVWHHRKTIVEWLRDGSKDKQLTASTLIDDSKNYHAWQHRQWVVKEFGLWDGELEFTETHLAMDIKNNSAWSHRFFIVKETRRYENPKWLDGELKHVHKKIEQLPNNESSWSYLRGLLNLSFNSLATHDPTRDFSDKLYRDKNCRSAHLLAFILDVIREDITKSAIPGTIDKLKNRADELCETLVETDKIRSRYWKYIGNKMKEL